MESLTLYFGQNKNSITIDEYGERYDRIFGKKKEVRCYYCLKKIKQGDKDHGGPCCDSCYFYNSEESDD